jgi:hypothetical protein
LRLSWKVRRGEMTAATAAAMVAVLLEHSQPHRVRHFPSATHLAVVIRSTFDAVEQRCRIVLRWLAVVVRQVSHKTPATAVTAATVGRI